MLFILQFERSLLRMTLLPSSDAIVGHVWLHWAAVTVLNKFWKILENSHDLLQLSWPGMLTYIFHFLWPILHQSNQLPPTNPPTDNEQSQVYCSCNLTLFFAYSKLAIFTIEFGEPVVIYNKTIYKRLVFDPDNNRSAFFLNYMTAHLKTWDLLLEAQ